MWGFVLKGRGFQPRRKCRTINNGFIVCRKLDLGSILGRFWVAQRFQRCDKALLTAQGFSP
jgi:hypothetical protein